MALEEIIETNKIEEADREETIEKWRHKLVEHISKYQKLEVMQNQGTSSIISLKLKLDSGEFMNKSQL